MIADALQKASNAVRKIEHVEHANTYGWECTSQGD
jgi:hypothetical protein